MTDEEITSETEFATDSDYEVGYGRPPKHTQFQTGQSGNPSGRPKGSINIKKELKEFLGEEIKVKINGRPQRMSRQTALLSSLHAKACDGDVRAAKLLIEILKTWSWYIDR